MMHLPQKVISVHNQECAAEDELYKTKSGDFSGCSILKVDTSFSRLQASLPCKLIFLY